MRPFLAPFPGSSVAIVTLLFAAIAGVQGVHAATLIVTTTADSGTGSLRDTIAAANSGDTIQFDAALNGQTITLTSAELLIDKDLTVDGPGANQLTVQRSTADGTPAFRILTISGSTTIAGLTVANGSAPDAGGGILCSGNVTLNLVNSTISRNSSSTTGGGISFRGSVMTITNSAILDNVATNGGGGISNQGELTVLNSTIAANTALGETGGGGGIFNTGTLAITNSTISGNSANVGGGIRNLAAHPLFYPGRLTITNSTISGNSAAEGGGLHLFGSEERSRNTIIALNTSSNGPDVDGELTSEGFNLIGNNYGASISPEQTSDQIGTFDSPIDPLLGPLQNNGGPTFTHALLQGSPAIDQGQSSGSTTDQRGFSRPVDFQAIANEAGGDGADIGALEVAPGNLANISTRLRVQTGDNVMIGGFIITGTQLKTVIVRGIGPSLPVPGALADPVIEVHGPGGQLLGTNDNWRNDANQQQVIDSGIAPPNHLESALWGVIGPGAYTVVVRGTNNTTGIGLFEVYDLDQTVNSRLANVSTRGLVQQGDNVLIGGLIVVGQNPLRTIVRAIGPSLPVPGALADPTLELYDGNGSLLTANDNWRTDQEAEIIATTIPPSNDLESAIVRDLMPGSYTAIVRGTTGIAVVEAYGLN